MKKIRLESGLNIEVHDEVTNDYRFFKSLAEVNNDGNIFALYQALGRLLDPAEQEKLEKHFEKDGMVPMNKVMEAIAEILTKLGAEGKN